MLLLETRQAIVDVPFLALVAAAGLCALRAGRAPAATGTGPYAPSDARTPPASERPQGERVGLRVPVLLALAGLLRPEGWLLALAWLAWALPAAGPRRRVTLVAVAGAAPVAWALLDLAATGDPLHSLNVTQGLAEQLDRPRDFDTAVREVPDYLRLVMTPVVAWVGLAGALAALVWLPQRALAPAGVAGVGLAAFLVLGVAGPPLLTRYLLLPAAILMLFAALLAAWFVRERRARWVAGGAAALVALAVSLPSQASEVAEAGDAADLRRAVADDLERILEDPRVAAALERCGGRLWVPDDRPRPLTAIVLDRSPRGIAVQRERDTPGAGIALAYAGDDAADNFSIGPAPPARGPEEAPAGHEPVTASASWVAMARC